MGALDARSTSTENTKIIVYAGLLAAAYTAATLLLAPVSFGPLQFRAAGLLVPVVLLHRRYALGMAIGLLLANIYSPFGWYDWALMPLAAYGIYLAGWYMRSRPAIALGTMAILSSAAIAFFPLHMGGGIPIFPTVAMILVAQAIAYFAGWYLIWHNFDTWIEENVQ